MTLTVGSVTTDTVSVRLHIWLDPAHADEAEARKKFAPDGWLDVEYQPKINFVSESDLLTRKLVAMYRASAPPAYGGASGSAANQRLAAAEPLQDGELKRLLAPVAEQGQSILERMIFNAKPRDVLPADIDSVQRAVTSALTRSQCIDIPKACRPMFPWGWLFYSSTYDPNDISTVDVEKFWGFQHDIQEQVPGTSIRVEVPAQPRVVKAICSDADTDRVVYHEFGLHADATHPLRRYPHADAPETVDSLKQTLSDFHGDCLYFFGHAGHGPSQSAPHQNWLELRGIRLTVADLQRINAPRFRNGLVIVFLNGCGTSSLATWDHSIPEHLFRTACGQMCCITTVAEVPKAFAAEFAGHFWRAFLEYRWPLGEALRQARLSMLRSPLHSPLGLVYRLFGRTDTFIAEVA